MIGGSRKAMKSIVLLSVILINAYGTKKKPTDQQCVAMKGYFEKMPDDYLQRAHFEVLENCLFYNLSQLADSDLKFANLTNTIKSFAPIKNGGGEKVQVSLSKTTIFYVMRLAYDGVKIKGSLNASWNDHRLRWNPKEWNLDKMKIKDAYDIWTPKEYGKYDKGSPYYNYVSFKDVWVDYKGQLTTVYQFDVVGSCETEYANFPMNEYRCCSNLNGQLKNEQIEYHLNNSSIVTSRTAKSASRIDQSTISIVQENNEQIVRLCLTMASVGSSQRTKLLLPVVISVLLVLVAPLFGTLQNQLYAKMFALLLQFLCFQFLAGSFSLSKVQTGGVLPKLFSFYEFTIAMTIASLLVTLVFRALSHSNGGRSRFPPSHRWKLFAALVNKCWFWSNSSDDGQQQQSYCSSNNDGRNIQMTNGHSSSTTIIMSDDPTKMWAYAEEWKEIFNALHSLVSLLLVILYVIISVIINF